LARVVFCCWATLASHDFAALDFAWTGTG
jgi:hypothetical protein